MKLFVVVFLLIGLPFITLAIIDSVQTARLVAEASTARGTIVDKQSRRLRPVELGSVDHPIVEFTSAEGERITFRSSTGSARPGREDSGVTVVYDPTNPREAKIKSYKTLWFVPTVLAGIGAVFSGVGVAFLVVLLKKLKLRKRLMQSGKLIWAEVTGVLEDGSSSRRGKHPVMITAKKRIGRKTYRFRSEPVWEDPEISSGSTVAVYIDEDDPRTYWVDIEKRGEK